MDTTIDIVATSARTPLGLRDAAAAAVRARLTGLKKHPFMTDQVGNLMSAALDSELDPHIVGSERLLRLAEPALREACASLRATSGFHLRLPVYLALPELRPGFSQQDAQAVCLGLKQLEGLPVDLLEVNAFTQGHAAGFVALKIATERLCQGDFCACLVGGVDSYFHPETMEWLDENWQLNGEVSRSGFVPGEGASFCLLMTKQACSQLHKKAMLSVRAVAVGREAKLIKTTNMCLGEGLAAVVREVVSKLCFPEERINEIICDINGERYRGEEWGFVCLRASQYFEDVTAYLSPAEYWGDMGAASVPLFAMLACQASVRGYAKGPRTMLWASSEQGHRGAAVLEVLSEIYDGEGHMS